MDLRYEYMDFSDTSRFRAYLQRVDFDEPHRQNASEIIFVVQGSVTIRINNDEICIREGEFFFLPPNTVFSLSGRDCENLLVALLYDSSLLTHLKSGNSLHFHLDKYRSILAENMFFFASPVSDLLSIVYELSKGSATKSYAVLSKFYSMIAFFLDNGLLTEIPTRTAQAETHPQIDRLLSYIYDNYASAISLKDIAGTTHYSYTYLSALFKETVGIGFNEYLTTFRINRSLHYILRTDKSIGDISTLCGFLDAKAFIRSFKKIMGVSPAKYRQENSNRVYSTYSLEISAEIPRQPAFEQDLRTAYQVMNDFSKEVSVAETVHVVEHEVQVDVDSAGVPLCKYWNTLHSVARADECLNTDFRERILQMKSLTNFLNLRITGIFSDSMMVIRKSPSGKYFYNFSLANSVIDFIVNMGVSPYICINTIPSALAASEDIHPWLKGNVSRPLNFHLWTDLLSAFFSQCADRYGLSAMEKWHVELWASPDKKELFWGENQEEYFSFYQLSANAIRNACRSIKIGGPCITEPDREWLLAFADFCRKTNCPCDFFSCQFYTNDPPSEAIQYQTFRNPYYSDPAKYPAGTCFTNLKEQFCRHLGRTVEFHVSQWDIQSKPQLFVRDTAFMVPYIIDTVLSCAGEVDSLGHWYITSSMVDYSFNCDPFFGDLSLINHHGIPKPGLTGYLLLDRLGETILDRGPGYVVTMSGAKKIQVLCYNLAELKTSYVVNSYTELDYRKRYFAFKPGGDHCFSFRLLNIQGSYKETDYVFNREHGSSFDEWLRMGTPYTLSRDEVEFLRNSAMPSIRTRTRHAVDGHLDISVTIPPHGAVLLCFDKAEEDCFSVDRGFSIDIN